MEITIEKVINIELARKACNFTIHNDKSESKISLEKIYQCEHSPIRTQMFWIEMKNIPTFVSVHLVRHKIGVEHFVKTMRDEFVDGDKVNRLTPINHAMLINAQSLINLARKRLCYKASKETRKIVHAIRGVLFLKDPDLAKRMVPECEYRGGICHELKPCGKEKSK